ncbi:MAG TPA: NAD(P)-binding domain-containing protein, partial [Candidatus Eisenbacteria bacterium]|nr:NAD(P)-binding domain-containing protein [Candidatus Eisenbacteria bacterium]
MKIGIIGVGNMGEALLSGIVKSENIKAQDLIVFDTDSAKLQFIENKYGVNIAESNEVLVKESQLLFLTIKPDIYPKLLAEIT